MISDEEILRLLKKKDLSDYIDPSKLDILGKALWTLLIIKECTPIKKISSKCISYILSELEEIPLEDTSISRALARAGDKVKRYLGDDGTIFYEIMKEGREYLNNSANVSKNIYFFSGKEAWSDSNKVFPEIIKRLEGDLAIVDSYYGLGTLFNLSKFGDKRKIRFMTSRLGGNENEEKFKKEFEKFKREFRNIEIRKYENFYQLHDRYILANNALVIIGHGIKDIGGKESFVIFLFQDEIKDIVSELKEVFEDRWKNSVNL